MRLGMEAIRKIDQLRGLADSVGLVVAVDRQGSYHFSDTVCLTVSGDGATLPIYRRETPLFRGDVEECIAWLRGWMTAREYLRYIGIGDDTVQEAEERYRESLEHERLMHAIKTGKDRGVRQVGQIFDEPEAPF